MTDFIDIRGDSVKETVNPKKAIYEKLPGFRDIMGTALDKIEAYNKRHSMQNMGGKRKDGKPDPLASIGHAPVKFSKRKKGHISEKPDSQGRVRWTMIYAHNRKDHPYATQKLQYKGPPNFNEAVKEANRILKTLCIGSGSKPTDMTLLSVSLINVLEDNMLEMGINVKEIINKRKGRG